MAAIILAAGKSTRMGEAKQLLRLGESTVLGQTIENVRRSAVDEIVLVLGSSAEAIRRQLPASLLEGLKVVINPAYEQGMASSLRAGLSALDPQIAAALIVLADQPFVRPETLDSARRSLSPLEGADCDPLVPRCPRKPGPARPLCLCRGHGAGRGHRLPCHLREPHREHTLKLEVEDEGILLDIDSQEDYERLREGSPPRTGE